MLFNSLAFLIFLPVVFLLYWRVGSLSWQNKIVVVASMFFYGWWDWRFLLLMIATCIVNYYLAIGIERNKERRCRKHWLLTAIILNIGLLALQ